MKRTLFVTKMEYIEELARVLERQLGTGVVSITGWTFNQLFNEVMMNDTCRFDVIEYLYGISRQFREKVREINQPRPADAGPEDEWLGEHKTFCNLVIGTVLKGRNDFNYVTGMLPGVVPDVFAKQKWLALLRLFSMIVDDLRTYMDMDKLECEARPLGDIPWPILQAVDRYFDVLSLATEPTTWLSEMIALNATVSSPGPTSASLTSMMTRNRQTMQTRKKKMPCKVLTTLWSTSATRCSPSCLSGFACVE